MMKNRFQQQGFTIVELMISMLIGLILIGGVTQIFFTAKTNLQSQRDLQTVAEDITLVARQMTSIIRNAGYRLDPSSTDFSDFFNPVTPYVAGQAGTGLADDRIDIRYQDDGTLLDCQGVSGHGTSASPVVVTNSYRIEGNQLVCSVDGGAAVPVADDVQALLIRYGEDTDGDGVINGYYRSASVGNWLNVYSVEFALVMAGQSDLRFTDESVTLDLLGVDWTSPSNKLNYQRTQRLVALLSKTDEG